MRQNEVGDSKPAVHLETVYPHPIERVWQALTSPESVRQWLLPGTFRPVLGQRFRFTHRRAGGKRQRVHCEVVELEAPHRVAYTWRTEDEPGPTLVSWTLEPVEGGTRVLLEHLPLESVHAPLANAREIASNGVGPSLVLKWTDFSLRFATALEELCPAGVRACASTIAPRRGRICLTGKAQPLPCMGYRMQPARAGLAGRQRAFSARRFREVTPCAR